MREVVLFGVGSTLIVDFEESTRRAGIRIAAGIKNHEAPGQSLLDYPIIKPCAVWPSLFSLPFIVPLFRPNNRSAVAAEAYAMGFYQYGSLVDETSILPSSLTHGEGLYINAGCVVGGAASFGKGVLINRGATIGHHARIADFASIGPGAVLAGEVTIGARCIVGAGAVILPKVSIGADAVVGAGAVVTRSVAQGCVVIGNPARSQSGSC